MRGDHPAQPGRLRAGGALLVGLALIAVAACSSSPQPEAESSKRPDEEVIRDFYELWFHAADTWQRNEWFGLQTLQNPFDVWVTQEILWEVKPDLIIETGTFKGGSTLLWATLLEQINPDAKIVTIDVRNLNEKARSHPLWEKYVTFLEGGSTDPEIVAEVERLAQGKRALVILDSDHSKAHVLGELRAYAPLVPPGSYVIAQDGFIHGHPIRPDVPPGPYEAVQEYLKETDDFEVDRSRERLLFTFNPGGFLKRVR